MIRYIVAVVGLDAVMPPSLGADLGPTWSVATPSARPKGPQGGGPFGIPAPVVVRALPPRRLRVSPSITVALMLSRAAQFEIARQCAVLLALCRRRRRRLSGARPAASSVQWVVTLSPADSGHQQHAFFVAAAARRTSAHHFRDAHRRHRQADAHEGAEVVGVELHTARDASCGAATIVKAQK